MLCSKFFYSNISIEYCQEEWRRKIRKEFKNSINTKKKIISVERNSEKNGVKNCVQKKIFKFIKSAVKKTRNGYTGIFKKIYQFYKN